ncbi:hypothetical protein SAMN06265349_10117 [Flavobacterium resistens]|uniref:Uncharacterized protein n=1 Tax=Flavobacterium resistens TaxID=443612 RepID=A0A521ABT1_9FLAO|nr:DUF6252 family protein [Flavobacterium resistens]MRX70485.1 hypothetical protein [Flavobacterium resistens]SMO32267.1 hypothetical protein SAMN06265349_10117 [Flavobacterium resistens]
MKKINIVFLLLFAISSLFSSCSPFDDGRDISGSENNGNGNGSGNVEEKPIFKAKIGGEEFIANTTTAVVTSDYVLIAGTRSSKGDLIQIILPSNKIGTYTWANSKENADRFVLAYAEKVDGYGFISASNEDAAFLEVKNYTDTAIIKITAVDKTKKTISGTFQFTGFRETDNGSTETKVVTDGTFTNVPYTEDIPADDSDQILKAKVNGVDFINDKVDVTAVSASGSNPYYSIVGKKNDDSVSVGLSINKSYGAGTYQVSTNSSNTGGALINVIAGTFKINDYLYTSKSGSITITSKTATKLVGTFDLVVQNFSINDEKTITGSFDIDIEGL